MKNHLKRIATPRTWIISRKREGRFIVRPNPGAHKFEVGLALGVVLRDVLGFASTMPEAKKLLHNNEVLVDGVRRKDHKFITGLFDVISFPSLRKYYRVTLDSHGRIVLHEVEQKEASLKVCKVVGKTALKGGRIQFNLHDGKNIIGDVKARVGDSLVLELPTLAVKEVVSLAPGVAVFLTKGKYSGDVGVVAELRGDEATYERDGAKIETLTKYLFAVGAKKPLITVTQK